MNIKRCYIADKGIRFYFIRNEWNITCLVSACLIIWLLKCCKFGYRDFQTASGSVKVQLCIFWMFFQSCCPLRGFWRICMSWTSFRVRHTDSSCLCVSQYWFVWNSSDYNQMISAWPPVRGTHPTSVENKNKTVQKMRLGDPHVAVGSYFLRVYSVFPQIQQMGCLAARNILKLNNQS